ncbi:hypothetical protein C1A50_2431 [Paenibacillus polymyxa]|nr:hypothetical protein C1A50_2431 [Paenibacillus polymyxa]
MLRNSNFFILAQKGIFTHFKYFANSKKRVDEFKHILHKAGNVFLKEELLYV